MVNKLFGLYFGKTSLWAFLHVVFRYFSSPLRDVEKYVPKAGRILDFGCGYGIFSLLLRLLSRERKITGLDIDEKKINIANDASPDRENITFTTERADTLEEKGFDTVIAIDVLYLISYEDQRALLGTFRGILKDRGVLLIKTMNPRLRFKFFLLLIQEFISVKLIRITKAKDRRFYFASDMDRFKNTLRETGFRADEIPLDKGFPHPHTLLLCRKLL